MGLYSSSNMKKLPHENRVVSCILTQTKAVFPGRRLFCEASGSLPVHMGRTYRCKPLPISVLSLSPRVLSDLWTEKILPAKPHLLSHGRGLPYPRTTVYPSPATTTTSDIPWPRSMEESRVHRATDNAFYYVLYYHRAINTIILLIELYFSGRRATTKNNRERCRVPRSTQRHELLIAPLCTRTAVSFLLALVLTCGKMRLK